jgi:hypothetical protein
MSTIPYTSQRWMLTISCAFIECLDEEQKPLLNAAASGFIRSENGHCFLYTYWHVVAGFDPHDRRWTTVPPKDDGDIDILGVFHGALDISRYQL